MVTILCNHNANHEKCTQQKLLTPYFTRKHTKYLPTEFLNKCPMQKKTINITLTSRWGLQRPSVDVDAVAATCLN